MNVTAIYLKHFYSKLHFEVTSIVISDLNLLVVTIYRSSNGSTHAFFDSLKKLIAFVTRFTPKARITNSGDVNAELDISTKYHSSFFIFLKKIWVILW